MEEGFTVELLMDGISTVSLQLADLRSERWRSGTRSGRPSTLSKFCHWNSKTPTNRDPRWYPSQRL